MLRFFFGSRARRVVSVVALFVVVIALLFLLLNWYVAPTKPSERKDLVLAMAQILGGTALLSGLYFTWRTLQVNREGQITERFTRAIDQLGKVEDGQKLFEIRLGGIYALERIARESDEDYWPIMEVLTAYVRKNAPWPPIEGQGGRDDATEEQSALADFGGKTETTDAPDPDIQAIMFVLRRRTRFYEHGEPERLDLHETNLAGVDLSETNLTRAHLSRANLSGANLWGANLSRANLYRAKLSRAHLNGANLSGAALFRADFSGAFLFRADFSGARLRLVDFSGADLSKARNLIQEQLAQAEGNMDTWIPPHLEPPAHWNAKTDEQPE